MGLEEHKRDYVAELTRGKQWQVGSRDGWLRRMGPDRWLGPDNMSWQGIDWQLGHIDFGLMAPRYMRSS